MHRKLAFFYAAWAVLVLHAGLSGCLPQSSAAP